MSQFLILIAAVYAVVVGYQGNGSELFAQLGKDLPKFFPWIVAIFILGILAVNKNTRTLGEPLLILIAMGIILRDWPQIKTSAQAAYLELTS